jgi:ribosomal-protein-alanine N-acetyltransferase
MVVRPWQHAGVADLVSLQTERLLLRPWRPEDRAPFAALNADPVVMRWFPSVLTREESDALVDRIEGAFAEHGWGLWAAERRDTGAFTGFIGLSIPGFEAPFLPGVEVGWRLAQEHWGRGFAPEGAAEALRFGFEVLGLAEVLSFTTVGNAKSRRVMEKLGLVHHPDEDFDHPRVPADSPIRPHVLYRITREAWRAG